MPRVSHILMLWRDSKDEGPVKAGWHFLKLFKELGVVVVDPKHKKVSSLFLFCFCNLVCKVYTLRTVSFRSAVANLSTSGTTGWRPLLQMNLKRLFGVASFISFSKYLCIDTNKVLGIYVVV